MSLYEGAPLRASCATLCVAISMFAFAVQAQDSPPSFSADKLDQLVSPVALYPDPLLSQVLSASSFPDEVVEANKWAQAHKDVSGEQLGQAMNDAGFTWDASVQALVPFPTVLEKMVADQKWMKELGNAVLAQKELATLQIVQIPPELNVGADYGMVVLKDAPAAADDLAAFILGEDSQAILARYGFGPGDRPRR